MYGLYFPTLRHVLYLHDEIVLKKYGGGLAGVRDHGLLLSALARPRHHLLYKPETSDLPTLAAILCYGLIKNHGFLDGNKRTAFLTMLDFISHSSNLYHTNSHFCGFPNENEIASTMEGVASNMVNEQDLAQWLSSAIIRNSDAF